MAVETRGEQSMQLTGDALRDERSQRVSDKIARFYSLESEIDSLLLEGKGVPDNLYQTHLVIDYWLAVNVPEWKSKYGFPSEQSGKKA